MYENIYRKDYINDICPKCKKQGTEIDSIGHLYCCLCGCILGYNVWAVEHGLSSELEKIKNDIDNINKDKLSKE